MAVLALAVVLRREFRSLLFFFGFLLFSGIGFLHCKKLMSLDGGNLGEGSGGWGSLCGAIAGAGAAMAVLGGQ